jgi:hypothetical protein
MKRTGESYAKAMTATLNNDLSLYESFQKEHNDGATYMLPEPSEYRGSTLAHTKGSAMLDNIRDDEDKDDLDEDDNGNGKRKHGPADAVPDHSMYARRPPTASGDVVDQEQERKPRRA